MDNYNHRHWKTSLQNPYSKPENLIKFGHHKFSTKSSKYTVRESGINKRREKQFMSPHNYSEQSKQNNIAVDIQVDCASRSRSYVNEDFEDSPVQLKALKLMNEVFGQTGVRGQLIFYMSEGDSSTLVLQNALDCAQIKVELVKHSESFKLCIGEEEFGRGLFPSKQNAKSKLFKAACEELRKSCFTIIKKDNFEDINMDEMCKTRQAEDYSMCNSKAFQMMKNMGWGGKGLGINEQGNERTVAESMEANISREGLGSDNVFKKIKNLLEDFAKSNKLTVLRFEPDFTSEDREQIHRFAQQLGLKSKSTGIHPSRRLTITKKLNKKLLIEQLLCNNCEIHSYKLEIPSRFRHKWI